MEGLLIAEVLRDIQPDLPSSRGSWRFPDAYTFVLPLTDKALWLYIRPPNARLAYRRDFPSPSGTHSSFQDLLAARVSGQLSHIAQHKLDRVLRLEFAADDSFVHNPATSLVAELTGRHCNLMVVDAAGMVVGSAREVSSDVNRFRQIRAHLPYQPPPPYDKLDPRQASSDVLRQTLQGKRIKQLHQVIDGLGPHLKQTLARTLGVPLNTVLDAHTVDAAVDGVREIAAAPQAMMQRALGLADVETLRKQEARAEQLQQLREVVNKRLELAEKRLQDIQKLRDAAHEVRALREHADVLMAYQHQVPTARSHVVLESFSGEPLTIALEPTLSAVQNAEQYYQRARKREQRLAQAEQREDALVEEYDTLETVLARLDNPETLNNQHLQALVTDYLPKREAQHRNEPFMRRHSPQGFSVLIGRNAKGNDYLTFKVAKSQDMWLHVQGYTGSHVIIQANKRTIPFETVLFAAQLAAGYSKANQSENVPVDYTLKKHVWRSKGMPAGAVHFSQQKTVWVNPSRHSS